MLAVRQRSTPQAGRARGGQCDAIGAARSPAALALGLQRTAGNRAVARAVAPRLQIARAPHRPAPVLEPGTGFDGIRQYYGEVVSQKNLTEPQKAAAREFRAWMETTFSPESGYAKGNWAREAGTRAARFPGDAVARANVYAEFQRQIVQVTGGGGSDWVAMAERGADGSYIFRGNPGIAEPKVFVIDPQGNCHAGNAKEALEGSGPGKRVNYSKLRQIGVKAPPPGGGGGGGGVGGGKPGVTEPAVKPTTGGAGEPAVTPKTTEPPTTGPKVEPVGGGKPTTSGGARIGGGGSAAEGKGPRISIRGVGGFVITLAVFWWLGSRAEKAEAASLDKLMADTVEPKIQEAFKAKSAEAERINTQSPENKLHANITVDFDYQWDAMGIGGTPSREHVYDARFVSLELGWKKKSTTTIIRHDKRTSVLGSDTYHDATRRVTWSVELDFGETDKQRKYRAHQKMAADFARRGKSAREAAESQHFDRGPDRPLSRKDMENQKWGLPTEADLLEMRDRELFVTAYIEYVAFYGPDEQYLPAIAYLRELEAARTNPEPKFAVLKKPAPLKPFSKVPAGTR